MASLWAMLSGHPRSLLVLNQLRSTPDVKGQLDGGVRAVPVSQVRGTDSRGGDFDKDFNPRHDHSRWRWQRIAWAMREGKSLPPVLLAQVGDSYFAIDGHHRISVARALGQLDIEARVIIWEVRGPLPWEVPEGESGPKLATLFIHAFAGLAASLKEVRKEFLDQASEMLFPIGFFVHH